MTVTPSRGQARPGPGRGRGTREPGRATAGAGGPGAGLPSRSHCRARFNPASPGPPSGQLLLGPGRPRRRPPAGATVTGHCHRDRDRLRPSQRPPQWHASAPGRRASAAAAAARTQGLAHCISKVGTRKCMHHSMGNKQNIDFCILFIFYCIFFHIFFAYFANWVIIFCIFLHIRILSIFLCILSILFYILCIFFA